MRYYPKNYKSHLDELTTEKAIRKIKDEFQNNLAFELKLNRVTAPLFVFSGTGLNDDLNGVERPVSFPIKDINEKRAEIVHSLAKWKRYKLAKLGMPAGLGIYTDMNAIRADEELDNLHSLYVDQWDWEKCINQSDRTLDYLKDTVRRIYYSIRRTEASVCSDYPSLKPFLPEEITFIHSEELEQEYPELTPTERETTAAKKYGAFFLIGIGAPLPISGKPHDGRAPDYDDWSTPSEFDSNGNVRFRGLNGDLIVYNPILERCFELSSMGIRVDRKALMYQLEARGELKRLELPFHKMLANEELPLSIGGGIGQSRLCMLFLQKAHIGEIQASIWPDDMVQECRKNGISLL